jgi:hypothetical protein
MKKALQLIALVVGLLATAATAEEKRSTAIIDHDPKTMQEFSRIVREAAAKGAVCVRFPSGEWNWSDAGHVDLPTNKRFSEWSPSNRDFMTSDLERWLVEHKVAAVQILMSAESQPAAYFQVEAILRSRKILYWVVSPDTSLNQKESIRLVETDGKARSVPEDAESPNKNAPQAAPSNGDKSSN